MKINLFTPLIKSCLKKMPVQNLQAIKGVTRPLFNRQLFSADKVDFIGSKHFSVEDVRSFFPNRRIDGQYLRRSMYKTKSQMFFSALTSWKDFKLWKHSIDLSARLKNQDYSEIADFINMFGGKYANIWLGFKNGDLLPNIEKLALFIRSIKRIDKLSFYKNLKQTDWEVCMDGIINKPEEVIEPLLAYKFDSLKINSYLLTGNGNRKVKAQADVISNFLNTQKLRHDVEVYRGEGSYGIFRSVKFADGSTLEDLISEFTEKIQLGQVTETEIESFVKKKLLPNSIKQECFLSTAIERDAVERYAKKVLWHIDVPKGAKGSMIESYNVERASEAELLMQKGSSLLIKNARYNAENKLWELWANLYQ